MQDGSVRFDDGDSACTGGPVVIRVDDGADGVIYISGPIFGGSEPAIGGGRRTGLGERTGGVSTAGRCDIARHNVEL